MELSSLTSFNLCAAPHEREDKDEGIKIIQREIQWQLRNALTELMSYYNIGKQIKLTFEEKSLTAPRVVLYVLCQDNDVTADKKRELLKNTSLFLAQLDSYADDSKIDINYASTQHIAQIKYVPKYLYMSLAFLREDLLPNEFCAAPHLNLAGHLLQRAHNYLPTCRMN